MNTLYVARMATNGEIRDPENVERITFPGSDRAVITRKDGSKEVIHHVPTWPY